MFVDVFQLEDGGDHSVGVGVVAVRPFRTDEHPARVVQEDAECCDIRPWKQRNVPEDIPKRHMLGSILKVVVAVCGSRWHVEVSVPASLQSGQLPLRSD